MSTKAKIIYVIKVADPRAEVDAINARCIAQHGMTLDNIADGAADLFDILTMNEVRSLVRCFLKRMRTAEDRQSEFSGAVPVVIQDDPVAASS
jgi:hypothetical protein